MKKTAKTIHSNSIDTISICTVYVHYTAAKIFCVNIIFAFCPFSAAGRCDKKIESGRPVMIHYVALLCRALKSIVITDKFVILRRNAFLNWIKYCRVHQQCFDLKFASHQRFLMPQCQYMWLKHEIFLVILSLKELCLCLDLSWAWI